MGVSCQRHARAVLPPGKTRYPLYGRLGGSKGRSGRVRNISPPTGFDPRTVQPVASRYTDWGIPAPIFALFYRKHLSHYKSPVLLVAEKLCFIPSDCVQLKVNFMRSSEVIPNYCALKSRVRDNNICDWSLGNKCCPPLLLNSHWNRLWRTEWGTPNSPATFGSILPAYKISTATVIKISVHKYNVYITYIVILTKNKNLHPLISE